MKKFLILFTIVYIITGISYYFREPNKIAKLPDTGIKILYD